MELIHPDAVVLDAVTTDILNDVRETAHKINDLRPLPSNLIESIHHDLIGERVYSSNAIEGNTYSLGETREILRTGYIDLGRKREATEVISLGNAIDYMRTDLLPLEDPFIAEHLLRLHGVLLKDIDDTIAGRFRNRRVMIVGAKHQPPRDEDVPELVTDFLKTLNTVSGLDPILIASWAHWCIARIHPFVDGNGRTARLWQDLVLFRNKLTCAIIPPESKRDYLESLAQADAGEFNPLIQLVGQRVAATFDKYLTAQRKVDATSEWAQELVGEATARAAEKRRINYLRWQRKMEELRYEFERCSATITHLSADTQIEFRSFDIIDQATWENIRSGIGASRNWLFRITFRRDARQWSYIFFFGRHFSSDLENDADKAEPRVCLLVGEQSGKDLAVRLDVSSNSPLTLREIFVTGKTFVRRRYSIEETKDVLDRFNDATAIARDFIRDVMLLRMI